MKIVCPFCKTEYRIGTAPSACVECAVCGNIWNIPAPARKSHLLLAMAALGALLAAAVFGAVAITKHNVDNRPLVAKLSGVRAISAGIKISGSVINRSDKIYGVPNLMIIAKDDKGNILSAHKIPAIATLIEAHSHLDFQHDLIGNFTGATLIDVEMAE